MFFELASFRFAGKFHDLEAYDIEKKSKGFINSDILLLFPYKKRLPVKFQAFLSLFPYKLYNLTLI